MILNKTDQLKATILALCRQPGKIALLTHSQPDGDGLAACLAMKEILQQMGFYSDIVLEKETYADLEFLDVQSKIKLYEKGMNYNIVFILDCHEPERTGETTVLAEKAANVLAIDHHEKQILNKKWYYSIHPEIVSAGVILFLAFENEIKRFPEKIRNYIVNCIYTTILNDTGAFINNNTDSSVFRVCTRLTDMGLEPADVMENFFLRNSPDKLRFIGQALSSIEIFSREILFFHSSLDQLRQNNLDMQATSGITRWIKGATGIKVIVFAREIEKDRYRLSLRSTHIDCNAICSNFGGGGHHSAAGCLIPGSLNEVQKQITDIIRKALYEK